VLYFLKVKVNEANKGTMHLLPKVDPTLNTTFMVHNSIIQCNDSVNIQIFSKLKDLSGFTVSLESKQAKLLNLSVESADNMNIEIPPRNLQGVHSLSLYNDSNLVASRLIFIMPCSD
jgi:hypothetical protein